MSFFSNLSDKFQEIKQDIENKKDFSNQLIKICKDGKITDDELEYIEQLFHDYDLEEKDLQKYNLKAFRIALEAVLRDGILTEDEEFNIYKIKEILEIDNRKITEELQLLQIHATLREIQKGNLPIYDYSGIILQNNEVVHFVGQAILLEEKVISCQYQGGSSGINVRVMKGVSFRVGQHKGQMITQTGIIGVDNGDFIVTNKRVMFKGTKKSFAYPFNQLIGFNIYTNGIDIHTNKGLTRTFQINQSYNPNILNGIMCYLAN